MLKKRSSSYNQDENKNHLMSDSSSDTRSEPIVLGQKKNISSFFSFPFKSFTGSDSVWSPTSPLDYMLLTKLGNPFRSLWANRDGSKKRWNCSNLGLGIVDSLDNKTNPPGRILRSTNNIPNSPNYLSGRIVFSSGRIVSSNGHTVSTKSLLKDYAIPSQTQMNSAVFQLMSTKSLFGKSKQPMDEGASSSSQPIDEGTSSHSGTSLGKKPMENSLRTVKVRIGNVSTSQIASSEYYTRVSHHGPNPKTTHIFRDYILECHSSKLHSSSGKNDEERTDSHWSIECNSIDSYPLISDDFLSNCYLCERKLMDGYDIYIYRGERSYCSSNCRELDILMDNEIDSDEDESTDNESTEPIRTNRSSF